MGIFKKSIIFCFVLLFTSTISYAANKTSIAVIPVNIKVQGSNEMAYPKACTLISSDIINNINSRKNIEANPILVNENILTKKGLAAKYNKFLTTYKSSYLIDYEILQEIAHTLDADKVLIVSGGFDVQQVLLSRPLTYQLNVPLSSPVVPLYKYNLSTKLVDPYHNQVINHKTYSKNFKAREFGVISDNFAENVVPIAQMQKFSKNVSNKIANNINLKLKSNSIVSEKTHTISTQIKAKNTGIATDGAVTTDGHPYLEDANKLRTKRHEDYENWVLNNL